MDQHVRCRRVLVCLHGTSVSRGVTAAAMVEYSLCRVRGRVLNTCVSCSHGAACNATKQVASSHDKCFHEGPMHTQHMLPCMESSKCFTVQLRSPKPHLVHAQLAPELAHEDRAAQLGGADELRRCSFRLRHPYVFAAGPQGTQPAAACESTAAQTMQECQHACRSSFERCTRFCWVLQGSAACQNSSSGATFVA